MRLPTPGIGCHSNLPTPTQVACEPGSSQSAGTFSGPAPQSIAPNGNVVKRRHVVLRFRNGSSWSTINLPLAVSNAEMRRLTRLVSERSGKPINEMALFRSSDL